MKDKELLDYCRVKKISEKGYGFLTSLYYDENVFFHFNGIKDPAVKEKLEKQQRGDLYFYYTSTSHKGKRRVYKLWLDISEVQQDLIPDFVNKIIDEFINGQTNPFEVAYVIKQLRENGYLQLEDLRKILLSRKLLKTPSILKAMLKENESENLNEIEKLINQLETNSIDENNWAEKIESQLQLI